MGIFGMGVVLAPALGPSIGGLLVEHFGWRSIFFVVRRSARQPSSSRAATCRSPPRAGWSPADSPTASTGSG